MIALNKTIGKFLKVGADKDKDIKSFAEPIGEVARTYRLDFLDLKMIGYELGIENPDVVLRKLGDKRLKQLGLEGLFQPGGLISRADWETIDGYSLMQEVAKDLGATPVEFVD